ncbi:MAG TPA: GNAT family N-acetyltransferase [Gaiellaceae bacterium]
MKAEIRRIADVGAIEAAAALFDNPVERAAAARFAASDIHHLLLAYLDGRPVGMVSGIELTHPDKGTEMFLYELAVDEAYRHRGIGTALVEELAALGRERGCDGMWVLTDRGNPAALATYRRAGARADSDQVMLEWSWPEQAGET